MGFIFSIEVGSDLADIPDVRLSPEGGEHDTEGLDRAAFLNASNDTAGLRVYQIYLSSSSFNRFPHMRW